MSNTKAWLSQLAPPAAIRLARRVAPAIFGPGPRPEIFCAGRYSSFEAARRAAGKSYADQRIAEAVFAKTATYREKLSAPIDVDAGIERIATTLALIGETDHLNVIDFGGAFGTHYWIAKALLKARCHLRWHVVETPEVCERAAELVSDELRFFHRLEDAVVAMDVPDLVYSDGVLHTLDDPLSWLEQLMRCGARYLCLRRVGIAEHPTHTVLNLRLSNHEPDVQLPDGIADVRTPIPLSLTTRESLEHTIQARYAIQYRFGGDSQTHRYDDVTMALCGYFCVDPSSSGHSRQ